jgi:hypothetical protein
LAVDHSKVVDIDGTSHLVTVYDVRVIEELKLEVIRAIYRSVDI